ncbi:MAG TPA: endonuclease/exonuclease/phosphatase family protein [Polyangiaceae bacterium]|jgi:endonuclease/exonuclease/phosphatase family metal-dependent hydrolase|nr:endonuclease/exonuclease/phosphatase family protein [Polyangiaceae bacterium]
MGRLRVLTLNIWNRSGPWEKRLELIRAGVRELDPDIIGLQEVICHDDRSQAVDIGGDLGYDIAFGVAHDYGAGVHFGNAVLSRWPIQKTGVTPLPSGDSNESRSLLFAEVASPHGKIPFFVTHLNWKFHEGVLREAQVLAIANEIKRTTPIDGLPPILVGDLNAQPESSEIRFLKGLQSLSGQSFYMADCFEQAGHGPGITFDANRNPFAAVTQEYPRRIDYVFVRGPDDRGRGKPLAASVVFEEVVDGVAATDHYGVVAEISI